MADKIDALDCHSVLNFYQVSFMNYGIFVGAFALGCLYADLVVSRDMFTVTS